MAVIPRATDTLSLAHELRETLARVLRRLRSEHGPPVAQLSVLGRLERDGTASVSDLAAAERMRPQSMAQIVGELQIAGLVERRADPNDGRRWFVELTAAGRHKLQSTRIAREDWLGNTLEHCLDADERELLRQATDLLNRIAAA